MTETALVFDTNGRTIAWHEPQGRSGGSIPDTRNLWDVMWENRHRLGGVAHTHPWPGIAEPSSVDLTTWLACDKALGQRLYWPIVTFSDVGFFVMPDQLDVYHRILTEPPFQIDVEGLRTRSKGATP